MIAASTSPRAAHPRNGGVLLRTQPDRRLAELAAEGRDVAFEEIVRRYRPGLLSFAARISSRDSADDVVQDSMLKAHAALEHGDSPESVRAWLFAIVRNTALNERRDRRVHQQLDENHDSVEQPPEAVDMRRRLRDLVQALAGLPAAQRQAIVQRELEGKGHDEIAQALQVSPGAVRQLIFRARSALRAGAGLLLPMQALRAMVLSGAADPGGSAAGSMAAKLSVGALLTAGALVAGNNGVQHHAGHGERWMTHSQAVTTGRPKPSRPAVNHTVLPSPTDNAKRVIVTPSSTRRARPSIPEPGTRTPAPRLDRSRPEAGPQAQPPPGGGGGSAAVAGPGGEQHPAGGPIAQASSTPQARDCPPEEGRDPDQGGVSPG